MLARAPVTTGGADAEISFGYRAVKPLASQQSQKMPQEPTAEELRHALDALEAAETIDALAQAWKERPAFHAVAAFVKRKDERKEALTVPADGGF